MKEKTSCSFCHNDSTTKGIILVRGDFGSVICNECIVLVNRAVTRNMLKGDGIKLVLHQGGKQ